jgi:hypothetical protein
MYLGIFSFYILYVMARFIISSTEVPRKNEVTMRNGKK